LLPIENDRDCHPEEQRDEGSTLRLSWAGHEARNGDPSLTLGMTHYRWFSTGTNHLQLMATTVLLTSRLHA